MPTPRNAEHSLQNFLVIHSDTANPSPYNVFHCSQKYLITSADIAKFLLSLVI